MSKTSWSEHASNRDHAGNLAAALRRLVSYGSTVPEYCFWRQPHCKAWKARSDPKARRGQRDRRYSWSYWASLHLSHGERHPMPWRSATVLRRLTGGVDRGNQRAWLDVTPGIHCPLVPMGTDRYQHLMIWRIRLHKLQRGRSQNRSERSVALCSYRRGNYPCLRESQRSQSNPTRF